MNSNQKIYLLGVTASATAAFLLTTAAFQDRIRKLERELDAAKFISEVNLSALVRSTEGITRDQLTNLYFASINEVKFNRIAKDLKE